MKFPHSFAVIYRALTPAQLAVCQRGQCIKVHLNSHDVRIQLYFCLTQFTVLFSSEPMGICDCQHFNSNHDCHYCYYKINYIFQKFQSAFSGNFAQVADILPFPVFHSERAPFIMEYFFLFVQTSHARLHLVAGSLPIGLQCPCVQQAKSSLPFDCYGLHGETYMWKFLHWKWEVVFLTWPESLDIFH